MSLSSKTMLEDIEITGKRVLLRVDFNVPMKVNETGERVIADDSRIVGALPTLKYIMSKKPKSIVIISHMGRPRGLPVKELSLEPLKPVIENLLNHKVTFLEDCVGPSIEATCCDPPAGSIFLLQNLRYHIAEVGRGADKDGKKKKATAEYKKFFRESLTKLGDVFINDAFGTAHRAHSSMVGINLPVRAAGYLLSKELKAFSSVLETPRRPYLAVLGGAKIRDKLPLIMNLLDKVDEMIVSGAMAYTFLRAIKHMPVGNSLYDPKGAMLVPKIMKKAQERGVKIHLPHDFGIAKSFSKDAERETCTDKTGIPEGYMALDVGPRTMLTDAMVIWRSKTIICNGPVGVFEFPAFAYGTISLMHACAAATKINGATTIIGGGDSALAAHRFAVDEIVTHVSTGGGACLELLEGKKLPGIEALSDIKDIKPQGSRL